MTSPKYCFQGIQNLESLRHPLGANPAELRNIAGRASRLYYVTHRLVKEDGSERVVYDTRQPLKGILQRLNAHFLRRVTYPDYLTGGLPGKDYRSNVAMHADAAIAVKEDVAQFYPSVTADVVFDILHRFFRFGDDVAEALTLLTTRNGHLEQGAPTSSYLANLAFWDVESAVVQRLAARGFNTYTRHADDINILSKEKRTGDEIAWAVSEIYGMLARKGLQAK